MIIKIGNVLSEFIPEDAIEESIFKRIKYQFAVLVREAKYDPRYKLYLKTGGKQGWSGKAYLIDRQNRTYTGLFPELVKFCHDKGISDFRLKDIRRRIPIPSQITTNIPLRDYQEEAIHAFLNHKLYNLPWHRGVLNMATGSGKSEVAIAIFQTLRVPTLFIVNKQDLLIQAKERFEQYGETPGIIGAGQFKPKPDLNIVTAQTIHRAKTDTKRKERFKKILSILKDVHLVIWDEAHMLAGKRAQANIFANLAFLMDPYCPIGLTATPFMKDRFANKLLQGVTGSVIYEVKSKDLVEQAVLTKPEITFIGYDAPKVYHPHNPVKWHELYDVGIVQNKHRNKAIIELAKNSTKPCLILVKNIEHGNTLLQMLIKSGIRNSEFLSGQDDKSFRKSVLEKFKQNKIDVLVSTTIFDEGVDIPNLQTLILAGGGLSKIKTLQRLGRGLRKFSGKHKAVLYDFVDRNHSLLHYHSRQRMKTLRAEGFEVIAKKQGKAL